MASKLKSMMEDEEDFGNGLLLRDIEEISKALYLHNNAAKSFNAPSDQRANVDSKNGLFRPKSEVSNQEPSRTDKKPSIWKWKPLKALAHIRNHRFNCCFFLYVHAVEGLPANFNSLNLSVSWERKGDVLRTCAVPVVDGMAEFEETLMYRCTVYANRSKNLNSAKYEPKLFLLCTSVIGVPELDIGKHWIDLTRLLPLTMEELEGDKRSSGKWTTSFKLSGKAKGAMLNVSFGFSVLDGNSFEPGYFVKVPGLREPGPIRNDPLTEFGRSSGSYQLHKLGSAPAYSRQVSQHLKSQSVDMKFIDEVFPSRGPELSHSITLLYQKLDEGKIRNAEECDIFLESLKPTSGPSPDSTGGNSGHKYDDTRFNMIVPGLETSDKDELRIEADDCNLPGEERKTDHGSQSFESSLIETINVEEIFGDEESELDDNVESVAELDGSDNDEEEKLMDNNRLKNIGKSIKELDSVSCERITSGSKDLDQLLDVTYYYEQENYDKIEFGYNKSKLKNSCSLDDIAESIENDFLNMLCLESRTATGGGPDSPKNFILGQIEENDIAWKSPITITDSFAPTSYNEELASADDNDDDDLSFAIQAFGKSHDRLPQSLRSKRNAKLLEDLETESLMHEWGLNESAFQNTPRCSSGAFGSPVYIPAEEPLRLPSLAEGIGPIIQISDGGFLRSMNPLLFRDAKNGARLVVQVSAPVVLPSAMGLTSMEILQSWGSSGAEKICAQAKELMPLEDISGKTMEELVSEAKSRSNASERWRLQHESEDGSDDMESEYVSFGNLVPMAITNIEGLLIEGLKIQSGIPDQQAPSSIMSGSEVLDVDKLVKLSVSLEKWMRLDSGNDPKDDPHEDILEVIAAHSANCTELIEEDGVIEELDRWCGILDNNFIMALRLQLRDPFRDYEMVGSSMLALIEVKRKFCLEEDGLDEKLKLEGIDFEQEERIVYEERIPSFKILNAHLAGLNVSSWHQRFWSTNRQQQSGYRWLHSSGVAKSKKQHISGLNVIVKSPSRSEGRDVLWSISSTGGQAAPWDEVVALNVHVRNPDIFLPNESSGAP